MWRYLVGAAAALALTGAGVLLFSGRATPPALLPAAPASLAAADDAQAMPDEAPAASAKTREEKRFGRYDKDKDGAVTRDEYLLARRKAFAKLDKDGNGQLAFDEWAIKATTRFAAADRDKSGAMTAAEFATTAVKRKARPRTTCPPASVRPAPPEEES